MILTQHITKQTVEGIIIKYLLYKIPNFCHSYSLCVFYFFLLVLHFISLIDPQIKKKHYLFILII